MKVRCPSCDTEREMPQNTVTVTCQTCGLLFGPVAKPEHPEAGDALPPEGRAPKRARWLRPAPWLSILFPLLFFIVMGISAVSHSMDIRLAKAVARGYGTREMPTWVEWYSLWTILAIVASATYLAYHVAALRWVAVHVFRELELQNPTK